MWVHVFPWKQCTCKFFSGGHPQRFRVTSKWVFHFWMIEPNLFIWGQNVIRSCLAIYGNACKVFGSISDLNSILKSSGNHQKSSESCPKVAQCQGWGGTSLPIHVIWSRFKSWTCVFCGLVLVLAPRVLISGFSSFPPGSKINFVRLHVQCAMYYSVNCSKPCTCVDYRS